MQSCENCIEYIGPDYKQLTQEHLFINLLKAGFHTDTSVWRSRFMASFNYLNKKKTSNGKRNFQLSSSFGRLFVSYGFLVVKNNILNLYLWNDVIMFVILFKIFPGLCWFERSYLTSSMGSGDWFKTLIRLRKSKEGKSKKAKVQCTSRHF